jgi:hypothetical protein
MQLLWKYKQKQVLNSDICDTVRTNVYTKHIDKRNKEGVNLLCFPLPVYYM